MVTNADLAARFLREAATFFREVGTQNPTLKDDMDHNAQAYEAVAQLVESDPTAAAPGADPDDAA